MKFKTIRQVQEINKKKVITRSLIQFAFTLLLLYSSFFIIGVPIEFIIPYILSFVSIFLLSNKYSDRIMRFYKDSNGSIFVDLGWFSNFCYILATVTRIIITSLGIIVRFGLPEKMGVDLEFTFPILGETVAGFVVAAIVFDFLLIYGKAVLAGMQIRMLKHYKLILTGKEEVKETKSGGHKDYSK
ncbi:MAG: hypothetical protein AB7O87_08015 [Candidatus Nitrosocosmicus sp.]